MGLNNFIGETRIYTRNGEYLKTISDITTKYNYDGGLITTAYPKLIDHTLKYESCKNTLVYDSVKNLLDDKGNSAQVVSGANCK